MRALLLLGLIAAPGAQDTQSNPPSTAQDISAPTLDELPGWRTRILPTEEESAFESIPWIPSFSAGVEQASKDGKPLLFWAMNGHPLGCT